MVLQSTVHIFIGVLTALILARKKVLLEIYAYRLHVPQYYFQRGNRYAVRYAFESFLRIVNKGLEALGFQNLPNWFSNSSTAFFRRDHYLAAVLPPLLLFW